MEAIVRYPLHCARCQIGLQVGEDCIYCAAELTGKNFPIEFDDALLIALFATEKIGPRAGVPDSDFVTDMNLLDKALCPGQKRGPKPGTRVNV